MKIRRIVIIVLVLSLISLYVFAFKMQASEKGESTLISFDKDGFVDSNLLTDTNKLVADNSNFSLYINETTSYFKVLDKSTGEFWESNPSVRDPWETDPSKPITNSAIQKQKSTLEITYFNEAGSQTTINNYQFSIYHPESILNDEGERTYSIKYVENGVQVLYFIEDLEVDYLYFPKYMPKEEFEAMEDFNLLSTIAYTGFNHDFQAYEIVNYTGMSRLVKRRLYEVFYEKLDYTRERAIDENESYGYFEQFEKIFFEIGIEIKLNDKGIDASIINESIVEPDNVKLARISLLPLFGTAVSIKDTVTTEGYIVVPDGSGAIIEFNNGKFYQNAYRKRLYGQDLSLLPYEMAEQQQKISIPLFGMVKEEGGFAAIITQGDAMAAINADVSERIDSYNKAFVTFNMRESESVTIGSGFNQYGVDLWTKKLVQTDFTVRFIFLEGTDNNYVGIAKAYQNYLIDTQGLISTDQTTGAVLTTEFIGAYDRKEFFLGIPYYALESLTTFDEAKKIVMELNELGINDMNVLYSGIMNGGLDSSIHTKSDIERVLGGQRDLNAFNQYLNGENIELYNMIDIMTASKYNRLFDQYKYTANRISGALSLNFNYHYPTRLPYSETTYMHSGDDYVINPLYYQAIYDRFAKDYDYNGVAFLNMGSILAGSYNKNNALYKQEAIRLQQSLLSEVDEKVMLTNPLGYAIPYTDYITDLPTETTLYAIIDYQIPLLQLVLSGIVDYSGDSINLSSDRSIEYQFLKLIETGSNVKYTLTYDSSQELLNTEYNYYMTTHYINWLDMIEEQITEINDIGVHEGYLVSHEQLSLNVFEVTYSHGLRIVINYNLTSVTVEGHLVSGMDYFILEGA
ncbi:MAG TPA: hypothetical protein DEP70_01730 [Acholeplasmataceae bacterium]|nr:hypothetical protein [Acholeplasmataceae bacterium]